MKATKAAEWAERKRLRSEEIASINEAISVLRSDDARDTFKKSFDSQSFIQLEKKHDHRRKLGLAAIRKTAAVTKDARLAALSTKERCEKERMENTQSAKMKSKEIDTNTETIDRLTASIAAAEKKIKEIEEEVEDLNKQKQDASDQRTKENTEYLSAKSDDEKAVELVGTAVAALQKFYTDNGLSFAQVRRVKQEPFVAAGEAPTPPPTTWDSEYGGAKGENKGIAAILELIAEDIKKDIAKATSEEEASVKAYDALVADVDASISSLETTKSDLEGTMADDESSMTTEKGERTTNQEDLDSTLAFLKEIAPGCDFTAVNFN